MFYWLSQSVRCFILKYGLHTPLWWLVCNEEHKHPERWVNKHHCSAFFCSREKSRGGGNESNLQLQRENEFDRQYRDISCAFDHSLVFSLCKILTYLLFQVMCPVTSVKTFYDEKVDIVITDNTNILGKTLSSWLDLSLLWCLRWWDDERGHGRPPVSCLKLRSQLSDVITLTL